MRLLNAKTRKLEEFIGDTIPPYAILSHTWMQDEVSFHGLQHNPDVKLKAGYQKIRFTCDQAVEDGLDYVWVDTCCIDKSSSAELSESINSMWRYYTDAVKCYAFLADVPGDVLEINAHNAGEISSDCTSTVEQSFRESRWFKRGWTLQELIAPRQVIFYGAGWSMIGARNGDLLPLICDITGIPSRVFRYTGCLYQMSIAKRMSWAASRTTARPEDEAYCLLGIFDVNMPMLYGEGRKAFIRLQEEIIKTSTDHSILAWSCAWGYDRRNDLLADSPKYFEGSGELGAPRMTVPVEPYFMTNRGLRITLPVIEGITDSYETYEAFGILNCRKGPLVAALRLMRITSASVDERVTEYSVSNNRVMFFQADKASAEKRTITIIRRWPVQRILTKRET